MIINFKKFACSLIIMLLITSMIGCAPQPKGGGGKNEKSKLGIYIDIKDKYSLEIINLLVNQFQSENSDVEINIGNILGGNTTIFEQINSGKQSDIIFTNRNNMLELYKKGLISDISNQYKDNKINENFYDIVNAYGRIRESYYGIGVIPYSVEFLYNKDELKKMGIDNPATVKEWMSILKKVRQGNSRIPVVLTEDLDINSFLMSLALDDSLKMQDLSEAYGGGVESYKENKSMQKGFDMVNKLVKEGYFDANTFEVGNENSISRLTNGDTPLLISTSYFNRKFNEGNVGVVEKNNLNESISSNVPVIVNALMCLSMSSKNKDAANKFIKYIFSNETQVKLAQLGYITGNKSANKDLGSISKVMVEHLYNAKDNSMIYIYNIPTNLRDSISSAINDILKGTYNGTEWMKLLKQTYGH